MLFSVAGGSLSPWAEPQMKRFALGLVAMFTVAMIPIWFWRNVAALAYLLSIGLLLAVELVGVTGMGAQRWIDLGFMRLQPSELMKITLVMLLAAYYDWLPVRKVSRPIWVLVPLVFILLPTALVLGQPDLGTAILLIAGGGIVMFVAGVSWWYFGAVICAGRRPDLRRLHLARSRLGSFSRTTSTGGSTPSSTRRRTRSATGYHITQSKIALGSGGWTGRGFMQGTQSRLNFLPEKHTDFIFTTLAEEFGFVGGISLLSLYGLIILFCIAIGDAERRTASARC